MNAEALPEVQGEEDQPTGANPMYGQHEELMASFSSDCEGCRSCMRSARLKLTGIKSKDFLPKKIGGLV